MSSPPNLLTKALWWSDVSNLEGSGDEVVRESKRSGEALAAMKIFVLIASMARIG
jgi:hypothetical protein